METNSPAPGAAYGFVERLHLRQWCLRAVLPLAALAAAASASQWPPLAAEAAFRGTGVLLVVASAALRIAAKGVLVRKTTLTTGGVYGVVRHPFYLANLAGAAGTFLLAGPLGAAVGAAWLVAAAPVYAATIAGEDAALRRLFPEEFAAYASQVRALVPGRPPPGRPAANVTWANLVAEGEPPRLLRFLAAAAVVAGLTLTDGATIAVLAAAALLFGASHGLRRIVAPPPRDRSDRGP
jgi:protein-S-isoprenylcysteine O-methyltransferase Ste14